MKLLFISAIFLAICGKPAMAINLSAEGAASFNANNYSIAGTPSPMLAGEATFGVGDLLQIGFVLDHNFLSYQNNGGTGSLNFYGGIARLGLSHDLFLDAQLGAANRDSLGSSFSWGVGTGIRLLSVPAFDLSPRISYRTVGDSGIGRSLLDIGLLFTLKLL